MLSASTDLGINNTQEHRINTVFIISLKWDIENHEIRWLCMKLNKLIVCQHCSTDLRSAVALLTLRTRSPVSRNHILNVTIECCIIHDYTCNLLEGKKCVEKKCRTIGNTTIKHITNFSYLIYLFCCFMENWGNARSD